MHTKSKKFPSALVALSLGLGLSGCDKEESAPTEVPEAETKPCRLSALPSATPPVAPRLECHGERGCVRRGKVCVSDKARDTHRARVCERVWRNRTQKTCTRHRMVRRGTQGDVKSTSSACM